MAISFDKAFGVHQYTLSVRAKRAEVLSSNIANADTPGFKARDINFSQALQDAQSQQGFGLSTTSEKPWANAPCARSTRSAWSSSRRATRTSGMTTTLNSLNWPDEPA